MNTKVLHSTENGGFWKLDRRLIYPKIGKIAEFLSKRWIPFAQNTWVCSHSGNTGIFGEWAEAKRFWISIQPTDPLGSISVFDWKLNHGPWTLWMAVEEQMSATQSAENIAKMKRFWKCKLPWVPGQGQFLWHRMASRTVSLLFSSTHMAPDVGRNDQQNYNLLQIQFGKTDRQRETEETSGGEGRWR